MISKRGFIIGVCLWLAACTEPPEELVKQAAQQRWQALLLGDLKQAYQYYTPAFQQVTPLDQFEKSVRGVGLWKEAEVIKSACTDTECQVDVRVSVAMKMRGVPEPVVTYDVIPETWLKNKTMIGKSDWRYVKK